MCYFVSLFLLVSTGAIDCLVRFIFKIANYVSSGTLNPTHSLLSRKLVLLLYMCIVFWNCNS